MGPLGIILLVLVLLFCFGGGGLGWYGPNAGHYPFSIGAILVIVLIVLLVTGRL